MINRVCTALYFFAAGYLVHFMFSADLATWHPARILIYTIWILLSLFLGIRELKELTA